MLIGGNPEKFAVSAEGYYSTYEEALAYLMMLANIDEHPSEPDNRREPFPARVRCDGCLTLLNSKEDFELD